MSYESKCLNWDGKWERGKSKCVLTQTKVVQKSLMEIHRFVDHLLRIQIKDLNVRSLHG